MLVQTQTLAIGQVTTQEVLVGLPLNGRSAVQLLVLEGGAVDSGAGGAGPWDRDEWDVSLSDGAVYRVFRDRAADRWFIDAIAD